MAVCEINPASEDYADFILRHSNLPYEEMVELYDTSCIDYVSQEFAILYEPLEKILPVTIQKYTYYAIPKLYTLLDTTSMEASGILQVFNQPALDASGEGTIIGFIDTGLDYQNPLFRNPDGTSRVLGIWDQTQPDPADGAEFGIPRELPTETINYGREYTKEQIDEALHSSNPLELVPSTDTNGHGTFLAGIAAGGEDPDEDFIGAAPSCMIGVVKLKQAKRYLREFYCLREDAIAYQENDLMMGIKYLLQLSTLYRMPITILIGLGTNLGSHTGTSPLGLQLQDLNRYLGVVAVVAAGNENGLQHHYLGSMQQNQEFEDVEIRSAQGENGFVLELWAREPELYTVGFLSPTGESIQRIPVALGEESRITFALERTVITVNYRITEPSSGGQLIFMRFEDPTPGIWRVRVYNALFITGQYHMWLPVNGFISPDTVFLHPNPDTTITDPGNTISVITVSAYDHQNNSIYIHSSRGFSRSGAIKPDIAAPGVNVYGPGLTAGSTGGRAPAETGTPGYPMTRRTGSSVAAAHAAGASACLLSWGYVQGNDTAINGTSVKSYLIRGAVRNPAYTYPNREWGYGALNLYNVFLRMRE